MDGSKRRYGWIVLVFTIKVLNPKRDRQRGTHRQRGDGGDGSYY